MEIRDVLTNIKKYDAWDYKNYPLRKDEADAIIENYKEPCEDAVSRAELEKCFTVDMTDISIAECLALIIKRVKALPSVQPIRPKGEWIGNENGKCSVCGHEGCGSDIWSGCKDGMFCPNCGADVRGNE